MHFVTALVKQTTKHFVTTVTVTNSTTHENHFQNTSALTGRLRYWEIKNNLIKKVNDSPEKNSQESRKVIHHF